MQMDDETKDKIRYIAAHADDMAIINSYIHPKQLNDIYRCRCPFHNERTPSFTIYPKGFVNKHKEAQDHMTYYCFGCGATGNIVNFVHEIENHDSYEETFDLFKDKYGLTYGEDEQLLELKQKLKRLESQSSKKIVSLNEINIRSSSYCRKYLFYIKEEYPQFFDQEFDYLQDLYIWMDDELNNKSAIELQGMYVEVMKKINDRKKLIEK